MPDGGAGVWRLVAFGARIALAGGGAPLRAALAAALPGARLEPAGGPAARRPDVTYRFEPLAGGAGLRVRRAGAELAHGAPDAVLARAVDALHFDVALHARQATFLHASVVRWQGRLLVFPGRTGAGKSTLAAFLAERGARYFSDEYAPVDAEGRIVPYPKAISLRPDVADRFAPAAGDGTGGAVPPHAVVFTRFRPKARFRPRPLTVEAAALSLIDNSVAAAPRPRQAAAAVARLLAHRPRLARGARGEVEDFASDLERWLATTP